MPDWRVILDGDHEPAYNMRLDEAILHSVIRIETPPTLRLYGWSSGAVTIGYHQKRQRVIDIEQAERLGLAVITRPTGGRAVLHGNDLTYSISAPAEFFKNAGITESYRILSEALASGLAEAGISVTLARGQGSSQAPGPKPCFASTARYELTWNGKKLVGSAQRRIRDGILQQGSIPLRDGAVDIRGLVPASIRGRMRGAGWTTIEDILGRSVRREEIARPVGWGFCVHLGVQMVESNPTTTELAYAANETGDTI